MSIDNVRQLEMEYRDFERYRNSWNLTPAITAYKKWHSAALILFSDYLSEKDSDYIDFKNLDYGTNGYTMHSAFTNIAGKYNLLMHKVEKAISLKKEKSDIVRDEEKLPMIFISHAFADKHFVEALVRLLEGIGFDESNLFCSSIPEYGIALSENIFDKLLNLFRERELYVLFIHSPRYYTRPVCLNEMGAAWALKSEYYSILTKDMSYDMMSGVVTSDRIAIKVDADDAKARMTQMFESLKSTFSINNVSQIKWERLRDMFLSEVNAIHSLLPEVSEFSTPLDDEYKRLLVDKMKREEEDLKRALIRGEIVKGSRAGSQELCVYNSGRVKATNVVVEWLNEDDGIFVRGDMNIGDLSPQNKRVFYLLLCEGHSETMNLRYTWSDELNEKNIYEEQLQLY